MASCERNPAGCRALHATVRGTVRTPLHWWAFRSYPANSDGGSDDPTTVVGHSRSQSDGGGRDLDELLGFRYAVGIIFGTFMLLPYVVMLYPAQLSSFFGMGPSACSQERRGSAVMTAC